MDATVKPGKVYVIDSSVAVKWLSTKDERLLEKSDKIVADFEGGKIHLIAPELSKYEMGNALLNKKISLESAKVSLASYYRIPIEFVPLDLDSAELTMEIALENKITFYDASFLAIAKKYSIPLITDNPKDQKQIPGVKVIPLKDYK